MRVTDAVVHVQNAIREDPPSNPRDIAHATPCIALKSMEKAMEDAEVDRVVIVPPRTGIRDIVTADRIAFDIARSQPHRFAVMGRIDADRPDMRAALADMMARPEVKGFRLNPRWESLDTVDWVWPEAARRGMPVAVHPKGERLPLLVPIIERNPELQLIIDSAGAPAAGPDPFADLDRVLALAKYDNVVVKLSGLTRHSRESYPFRDLYVHIRRMYDAFGPDRLAWGSDYSYEVGRVAYRETVDMIREECEFLSSADREWILNKTISRILRWP